MSEPEPPPDLAGEDRERFLEEIVVEFILQREEGKNPDIDAYLARYPRHAEDLAFLLSQETHPPLAEDAPSPESGAHGSWPLRAVGPYEIGSHVASTGGSHVYRARHVDTQEDIALKVFKKRESLDPREVKRFKREARMLSELSLPHVVPVHDLRESDDAVFMAMPWIDGVTLQEAIQVLRGERPPGDVDPRRLSFETRARIVQTVAETLDKVQARGIRHRDLKPSNIMIDRRLEPMIIDFGIALHDDLSRVTRTDDAQLGSPRYLAPELLLGDAKSTSIATDVYALGMTLYEFLTARPAFAAEDRQTLFEQILGGDVAPPRELDPRIPDGISAVVMRAVARDPEARYRGMADFARALGAAAAGRSPGAARRRARFVLGAALVAAAVAAAAWWIATG